MNALAPRKPSGAQPGNRNASRLNPKVKAVVALLLTDPDISVEAACERSQCPRRTFYKAEHSEAYAAHLASLGRTRLRTRIVAKALRRYEALLDSESDYVAADIAKDALAQARVRDKLDSAQRSPITGGIRISFVTIAAQHGEPQTQHVVIDGLAAEPDDAK